MAHSRREARGAMHAVIYMKMARYYIGTALAAPANPPAVHQVVVRPPLVAPSPSLLAAPPFSLLHPPVPTSPSQYQPGQRNALWFLLSLLYKARAFSSSP